MAMESTLYIKRFDHPRDRRLGRHIVHDAMSLRYPARASDPRKLKSVKHFINIPTLDQGDLGSCTGHAGTYNIAGDAFWAAGATVLKQDATIDHQYAVGLYSDATKLDPWPGQYEPEDTGSDGLSIAKALLTRGLISGYQHALSLAAALTALSERPVIVGTSWLEGMYSVNAEGLMNVSGEVLGGHEYVLDELDTVKQRVGMRNSWGPGWGLNGRAYMTYADLAKLLDRTMQGDCTVFIPRSEPAPQPEPAPEPKPDNSAELAKALTKHLRTKSVPHYVRTPAEAWLKSKE